MMLPKHPKQPSSMVEDLIVQYRQKREEIQSRLKEFMRVPESQYFYELVYCLLTPQSSAENAWQVVESLRRNGFQKKGFNPEPYLSNRKHYIRFHRSKSQHLLAAREKYRDASSLFTDKLPAFKKRELLVASFKGLGYKESTHFLRNIGKSEDLAILDRHILRCLQRYNVIGATPATLSKKIYLEIEAAFQEFAAVTEIPMTELDLLFWWIGTGRIFK